MTGRCVTETFFVKSCPQVFQNKYEGINKSTASFSNHIYRKLSVKYNLFVLQFTNIKQIRLNTT